MGSGVKNMRKQSIVRALAALVLLALFGCSHSNQPSTDNSNSGSSSSSSSSSSTGNNAPAPAPAPIVIPAGKVLTVTVDQDISTKTNSSGDVFAASLAEPVTVDGQTVIPSGTHATGTIVQAQAAGHLKGGAILALTLDSISLSGQKYSLETTEFEEAGKGRGKRTAIGGGGAAFGAIVGALAGGGKGAAIGALAGGGAGTAGAAYTGKRDITIPAETRLHFKLKDSLTINP